MKKNDIVRLEITGYTQEGNGVGRTEEGMAVFVPLTAAGDIIEARIVKLMNSYAYGRLERVLSPSGDRIEPDCPVYSKCGGCALRHISYEAELRAKEGFVRDAFRRIGGFLIKPEPIVGCKRINRYRNKAQLPVAMQDGRPVYGFFAPRSHRVIASDRCLLQPEVFTDICEYVRTYIEKRGIAPYDENTDSGLLRHIYIRKGEYTGEILLTLIVRADTHQLDGLADAIARDIRDIKSVVLNINDRRTNVILGERSRTLYGDGYITDRMCKRTLMISPGSFYQVNTPAAEEVYRTAGRMAGFRGSETVLDLYCGIGSIGLSMADSVKRVIGAEVIEDAVKNAEKNAALNGLLDRFSYLCGDAGEIASRLLKSGAAPDAVILDPPRKGCDSKTLDAVLGMSPEKIIYISCNPSTAARDCKMLCSCGYTLIRYKPMDMFPRTNHVETVVLLSKGEVDSKKIRVEFSLEDMDMSEFQDGATYPQIKEYVLEHTGLKVSNLYISQIKRKCGIEVGKNYNLPKSEDSRQPQCPPEKEKAIREAFKYFGMI